MTREDKQSVISICRILADKMDDSGKVAVEQVISAVRDLEEQLPEQEPVFYPQVEGITPTVVRQEPCEDAISRQAAKRIIFDGFEGWPSDKEVAQMIMLTKQLDELPPVTPKQRTGHWERHYIRPNVYADLRWYCSACGDKCGYNDANLFEYCPHCGARMESKEQE